MSFGVHIPELQLGKATFRAACDLAVLQAGERYLELGSGEGIGLGIAAAEYGARVTGVEILPHANAAARTRALELGVELDIVEGDLLLHDPSAADMLLLHLGPAFHDLLADRLSNQLPTTTRVVACGWKIPGWIPLASELPHDTILYLYAPGDPIWQAQWHQRELTIVAGQHLSIDIDIAVDAEDLELRVSQGTGLSVTGWPQAAHRGQTAIATIAAAADAASGRQKVTLWGTVADQQRQLGSALRCTIVSA